MRWRPVCVWARRSGASGSFAASSRKRVETWSTFWRRRRARRVLERSRVRGSRRSRHLQGDWEAALTFGEAALPDLRTLRDDRTVATHLGVIAISSLATGDLEQARAVAEEGLELAQRSGDAMSEAYARNTLGAVLAQAGQLDDASRLLTESVAMARRQGNVRSVAMWSRMVGNVALARGDREQARLCFEESLAVGRTLADPWATARALSRLALMAADARRRGAGTAPGRREHRDREGRGKLDRPAPQPRGIRGPGGRSGASARGPRASTAVRASSVSRPAVRTGPIEIRTLPTSGVPSARRRSPRSGQQGRAMTLDEALDYALEEDTDPRAS